MPRRDKKKDDLDTETTIVDMNVEGFKWYDPSKKKNADKKVTRRVSRKEYRAMVRAAFAAYLPVFIIVIIVFALMVGLAYLWLS